MKILVENLEFECIIGLLDQEREMPQKVIVDIKIDTNEQTMCVDYAKVAKLVEGTYKKEEFLTIENSLLHVSKVLKEKFPKIKTLSIKTIKPNILPNCRVGAEYSINY